MNNRATLRLVGNLAMYNDEESKTTMRFNRVEIDVPIKLRGAILKIEEVCKIKIVRDSVLILVNGVEANALDDLETIINEQDEVVFVPMYHGG